MNPAPSGSSNPPLASTASGERSITGCGERALTQAKPWTAPGMDPDADVLWFDELRRADVIVKPATVYLP